MEIRRMRGEDSRLAVSRIYEESWKSAYRGIIPQDYLDSIPSGCWAAFLDSPSINTLLMLEGEEIVGTSSYCRSRFREMEGWGEIVSIYLLPQYTGRGCGRLLLDAALSELVKMGFQDIFLYVLEENKNARRFYEQNGFIPSGEYLEDSIGGRLVRELQYIIKNPCNLG